MGPSPIPVLTNTQQKIRTPYAQHYNVEVQHELPGRMLLEVGYVGTSGTKLPRFRQVDQAFITQKQLDQLTPDIPTRLSLMGIPSFVIPQILAGGVDAIHSVAFTTFFRYAQIFKVE